MTLSHCQTRDTSLNSMLTKAACIIKGFPGNSVYGNILVRFSQRSKALTLQFDHQIHVTYAKCFIRLVALVPPTEFRPRMGLPYSWNCQSLLHFNIDQWLWWLPFCATRTSSIDAMLCDPLVFSVTTTSAPSDLRCSSISLKSGLKLQCPGYNTDDVVIWHSVMCIL